MAINAADKKRFLNWFVTHESFARREVSWILNYLANHETILKNILFVEHAEKTPRGICVRSNQVGGEAIIFHEIRLNWKEPLFLECCFSKSWENELYLAALEDNPHHRWNETIDAEVIAKVEEYFFKEDLEARVLDLYKEIDRALEKNDHELFLTLSAEVNELLEKKALVAE